LDLVGKLFLNPGDHVVTEEPTFLGALQAWNAYQALYLPVPIDDDGIRIHRLEEALRSGPKLLYILPNFQNPSGVTLSLDRRHEVVDLACRYGVPVIEDDPYGQLRYEGEHLPPLVQVDAEMHRCARGESAFHGGVLYMGSFSKTLAPGFRLGWVVAPEVVLRRLVQVKQGSDLHTSTFSQMIAYEVARGGFLDAHVRTVRRVYRERRDAMLKAMEAHFPPVMHWTRPQGGLFLWATLPEGQDSAEILKEAIAEKVAFVPGASFFPREGGARTFRLNFSYCAPDVIEEGIRRLGRVLDRHVHS
jgi:2-aminoadipate transaminase